MNRISATPTEIKIMPIVFICYISADPSLRLRTISVDIRFFFDDKLRPFLHFLIDFAEIFTDDSDGD